MITIRSCSVTSKSRRSRAAALLFLGQLFCGTYSAVAQTDSASSDDDVQLALGGALRFNAFYKTWDEANKDRGGDIDFDTFRVNVDASYQDIYTSIEYRFYSGYHMLHHGYFGYKFDNGIDLQFGVHRNPFGLLPYASHNWFFDLTYYLGMEDDYDMGLKAEWQVEDWNLQFAFYKTDEGHYTGDSIDSARYSYDIVASDPSELAGAGIDSPRTNEEINQLNIRTARMFSHSASRNTEIGLSVEYGGIWNRTTQDTGDRWAAAVHMNGTYGRYNVMLEALRYQFSPKNPPNQTDQFIVMGAYDAPYKVASEGSMFIANVSYTLPIERGPIDSLTFYNDFSYLKKDNDNFSDSEQNVLGMLISAGPLFTYVDFAFGRNHPWLGPDYASALAEGSPNSDWELRFNINVGYYF